MAKLLNSYLSKEIRPLPALLPEYFLLEEHAESDLIAFTKELAKSVKYYDLRGNETGTWEGFLQDIEPEEAQRLIDKLAAGQAIEADEVKNISPHEALFLAFLYLLRRPKERMQEFSRHYMDYYYRDCLGLKEAPSIPGKVHVTFELDKEIDSCFLKKGTLLKAGKDSAGTEILYETENSLLLTQARIKNVKTIANASTGIIASSIFDELQDKKFTPRAFKTFGEEVGEPANIGFAFSSPILFANSGKRTLTIDFNFSKNTKKLYPEEIKELFDFYITSEEGWIELKFVGDSRFGLKATLPEKVAYSKNYDSEVSFNNAYPIIKAILKSGKSISKEFTLDSIELELEVDGITDLKISNDFGLLDPKAAIYPFGTNPVCGSSFYFSHPDLIGKNISSLTLKANWQLPEHFDSHYVDYGKKVKIPRQYFTANLKYRKIKEIEQGQEYEIPLLDKRQLRLFDDYNALSFSVNYVDFSNLSLPKRIIDSPISLLGYFKLSLNQDFLQSDYQKTLFLRTLKTRKLKKEQNDEELEKLVLNPPYIPLCKGLTMKYTAKTEIDLSKGVAAFKYIGPFGGNSYVALNPALIPSYPKNGCLLIEIAGVQTGVPISFLWQAAEKAKNTDIRGQEVTWRYLQDEKWESLTLELDDTQHLSKSGTIHFKPLGLKQDSCWLRVDLEKGNFPLETFDIRLHSAIASVSKQLDSKDDLSTVKSGTINSLYEVNPKIKTITQPYASFGGRQSENRQDFWTRISQRMNHKQRAVTPLDYERLILTHFPDVYAAKCLKGDPGEVRIIILPTKEAYGTAKAVEVEREIKEFLKNCAPPLVSIEVIPFIYNALVECKIISNDENLAVTAGVLEKCKKLSTFSATIEFEPIDETPSNLTKLFIEDMERFLSPWGYNGGAFIDETIYESQIVNFIKARSYIHQVISLKFTRHR